MKIERSRILASWLCLAAVLATALAPARGLMLCVGLDGHVDVATEAGGCVECPGEVKGPLGPAEAGLDPADSCCPCVDVPLVAGADVAQNEQPRLALGFPDLTAISLPVFTATGRLTSSRTIRPGVPPSAAPSFATSHLRSVVLLV